VDRARDLGGVSRLSSPSPRAPRSPSTWQTSRDRWRKSRSRAATWRRSAATFSAFESFRRSALLSRRSPSSSRKRTRRPEAFSKRAGSLVGSTAAGDPRGVNSAGSQRANRSLPRWRDVAGCPVWRLSSAQRSCAPSHPDGSSCRWTAGSSVSSPRPCPARSRLFRICVAGSPSWRRPGHAAPCRTARDPCSRSLAIAPLLPVARKSDIAACWQSLPARRRNPGRNSNLGLGRRRRRRSHYATRVRHGRITVPRSRRKLIPKTAAKSDSARSTIGPSAVAVAASRPPAASPRSPSLARISTTGCSRRRFLADFLDRSLHCSRHCSLDPSLHVGFPT